MDTQDPFVIIPPSATSFTSGGCRMIRLGNRPWIEEDDQPPVGLADEVEEDDEEDEDDEDDLDEDDDLDDDDEAGEEEG